MQIMEIVSVLVRYHGPTNTRPARYSGEWRRGSDRVRVMVPVDYAVNRDQMVESLVQKVLAKAGVAERGEWVVRFSGYAGMRDEIYTAVRQG